MFNDARFAANDIDLHRFVPGFEKTFCGGLLSLKMRFPYATTISGDLTTDGTDGFALDDTRFGNVAAYTKVMLVQRSNLAISGGLGVTIPTADEINVRLAYGTDLVHIANHSAHLQPFIAAAYAPNDP